MQKSHLSHRNITGYDRREAETVWALYKQLTDSKPLKDASRDDGRLLVQRFKDDGNKSATITKKVGWMWVAFELAIDEGKLKFNPFSNVVPKDDDETERLPLGDAEMTLRWSMTHSRDLGFLVPATKRTKSRLRS